MEFQIPKYSPVRSIKAFVEQYAIFDFHSGLRFGKAISTPNVALYFQGMGARLQAITLGCNFVLRMYRTGRIIQIFCWFLTKRSGLIRVIVCALFATEIVLVIVMS